MSLLTTQSDVFDASDVTGAVPKRQYRSDRSDIDLVLVENRVGHVIQATPLLGVTYHRKLVLAKNYLPAKFQVRSFIHSKDIERYQKIRKWVTTHRNDLQTSLKVIENDTV